MIGRSLRKVFRCTTGLAVLLLFIGSHHQAVEAREEGLAQWERVQRVNVFNSPRRARYPSIARVANGSLLVLFTRQTATQEKDGLGDLLLVRSVDDGQTWLPPSVVYQGKDCEPRAVGTMTVLEDGRIIAPFTELRNAQTTSTVRILTTGDSGNNWQVIDPEVTIPLAWWAPCGKMIETGNGTLVMPVYGALSEADLKATIHNCGLLRSHDGGKTWSDFTWIARGAGRMIGTVRESRFSFEGPSVLPLHDGRWLAMVSARRLNKAGTGPTETNEGSGAPQEICRLWSSDEGRTWTKPEQFAPGGWPCLAGIDQYAMCVNTIWPAWADMRLLVSNNGFATFYREVRVHSWGWLQGMHSRMQEVPSPPIVPHLGSEWLFEHYGFPSVTALDEDNLIVVYGRDQRTMLAVDPESDLIPLEQERIQATFFRRTAFLEELAQPLATKPTRPEGRWVLAERKPSAVIGNPDDEPPRYTPGRIVAQTRNGNLIGAARGTIWRSLDSGRSWSQIDSAILPDSERTWSPIKPEQQSATGNLNLLGVLSSGRWLAATTPWWKQEALRLVKVGERGGFPTFKMTHAMPGGVVVCWSDDQGKTWDHAEPFKGPFILTPSTYYGRFVETADGAVLLSCYGSVTGEEQDASAWSIGVIRSNDGGETWGDFSFVYRAEKRPDDIQIGPQYGEHDIVALPNGNLVAFARLSYHQGGPRGWGWSDVKISTDFGRTWNKTGGSLYFPSQTSALALPDGGLAFTYRAHSWQSPGVAISYDEGRSFNYMLTGPYETAGAFLTSDDEFLIYVNKSSRSGISGVYRYLVEEKAENNAVR